MTTPKRKPAPVRSSPTSTAVRVSRPAAVKPVPERRPAKAAVPEPAAPASPQWVAPAWLQFTTFLLALAGLGVSIYLTYEHYTNGVLAGCNEHAGTIDCAKVTTSHQSFLYLPGWTVPVAVLGLAFYAFLVPVMSPWAWRLKYSWVHWVRLAAMVSGIGFVLWLLYAELFKIQAICLYCTSVHVLTFLIFCLTVFAATMYGLTPEGGLSWKQAVRTWPFTRRAVIVDPAED
jgi:uncharacterized membrane protein